MGTIEDSIAGIFRALEDSAVTMQQGGGIGLDFSTLRPRGARARGAGAIASGPVSFMQVWDAMCGALLSTGVRRGAMMATLRCDHPDIEEFVRAKQQPGQLRRFNLSVLVTDAFIKAVRSDAEWPLVFPAATLEAKGETILCEWPGQTGDMPCRILRRVRARELWDRILRRQGRRSASSPQRTFRSARTSRCRLRCSPSSTTPSPRRPMYMRIVRFEFRQVYDLAYDLGLKGCTTFRPNPVTGAVLSERASLVDAPHCCIPEREAD